MENDYRGAPTITRVTRLTMMTILICIVCVLSHESDLKSGSTKNIYEEGNKYQPKGRPISKVLLSIVLVMVLAVGFMMGILIGRYAICHEDDSKAIVLPGTRENLTNEEDSDISKKIMDGIDPARIEDNLRELTLKPHIAGRQRDFELVDMLKKNFTDNGLEVQVTPYNVLLSYPGNSTPNSVQLLHANGTVYYDTVADESYIDDQSDVVPPFLAYSPKGSVRGELVYAGYGRVEDYYYLREQNVNVSGKIVIVKYGKIYRGDKVDIATDHGAIGIIIYSDPADCTGYKLNDSRVYPETWWLPSTGVQRGTIFTGDGDPLTPGYPANNLAYRFEENTVEPPLPKIPAHPIGYGAARHILSQLSGKNVTPGSDFYGGLNITYKLGPGFIQSGMTIELNVTSQNEQAKVENVFGFIKGSVEPDRYVLFGNHRDAWNYGAIDPSSGTAVMMEMARVMGQLVKKGDWRPRRSIVFCSWGAQKYGLLGSTEWVEQYVTTLRERVVAYINLDTAVQGNDTLKTHATPLMYNIIYEASKKVKNPNTAEIQAGRTTVYDTWLNVNPWDFTQGDSSRVPSIYPLGSSSDYAPLLEISGISSIDLRYSFNPKIYDITQYPLFHTQFEVFDAVKNLLDRDFEFHAAVARVCGEMARNLADSLILPFNISNYAAGLELNRKTLDKDYGKLLEGNLTKEVYGKLETVIAEFRKDVTDFEARMSTIDKSNPFAIREYNDQIMLLERAFLSPWGLPLRPLKKHLIFAENMNDAYAGSSFPGLIDLLFEISNDPEKWEKVKQHFHIILQTIQSAGATLREVTKFMSETL